MSSTLDAETRATTCGRRGRTRASSAPAAARITCVPLSAARCERAAAPHERRLRDVMETTRQGEVG
jgi:hypothetical protein